MIVPMSRVRIIGPKDEVDATLRAVQDLGQLQLAELPDRAGVGPARLGPARERRRRQLTRLLEDARDALHSLRVAPRRVIDVLDEKAIPRSDRAAVVANIVDHREPGAEAVGGQHVVHPVGGIFEQ